MNARTNIATGLVAALASLALAAPTSADPCGMVPPVYVGPGKPIERIGVQKTYVFHADGVETFVIRPGFQGQVDEFGMLIPFPSPPAIRKVADDIFSHIAAAIDPPEVVIDLTPRPAPAARAAGAGRERVLAFTVTDLAADVRVLREEAVGMYEVAVLEAGSARALAAWMDRHGYRYPDGMDAVCNDYVNAGWCFVAVKTRVGHKAGVNPRPGMRVADPTRPEGRVFDGHVQAMGFRFRSAELVVPMRLSAFNEGSLRNVVYLLADERLRVRNVPMSSVRRQITGDALLHNVTSPLPLRIIGGDLDDVPAHRLAGLSQRRDAEPHNGLARELFAGDLLAARTGILAHSFEEREKELLAIGERLNLRGPELDALHHDALAAERTSILEHSLAKLRTMTLTVIDGDFPRQVIAGDNIRFDPYVMPEHRNSPRMYDAKRFGPAAQARGRIIPSRHAGPVHVAQERARFVHAWFGIALVAAGVIVALVLVVRGRGRWLLPILMIVSGGALAGFAPDGKRTGGASVDLVSQGWRIVAIVEEGGADADADLTRIIVDSSSPLVRTWAAAGRIAITDRIEHLQSFRHLVGSHPALKRPLHRRMLELLHGTVVSAEILLRLATKFPEVQDALTQAVLDADPVDLVRCMMHADDNNLRRTAAAYLATIGQSGRAKVAPHVIDACRFRPGASDVPWRGGAMFVPSVSWSRDDARALARELIAWHLWAGRSGRTDVQQQIHNNLRSVGLSRVAGYEVPRRANDTRAWLMAWRACAGPESVAEILREQGLLSDPKYADLGDH
ncbi:MAG: DUF2330 domain-containing protein [Planctomycetota bacterium]|jgi:hypothetical protein